MIVDRIVKAGLVKRVRDKSDRRVVYVFITSNGEKALKPATLTSFECVRTILSPLSHEARSTLLSLLETVKYEILEYLNPGVDIEEVKRNEFEQAANLKKWLSEYGLTSTLEAKRQSGKKRKTVRRG